MTFFVDANYTHDAGHTDVYTIDLDELDWEDVNTCIGEIFKWENENGRHVNFIEVWEDDDDENALAHYSREEALDICNPILARCRSIWR